MKPLTDQEIVDALELEMRKELDAYKNPQNIVYSVTQKEILAFARQLGVPVPATGPGRLKTGYDIRMDELTNELTFLQADLGTVTGMLESMNPVDDVIGHLQFSQRKANLEQQIKMIENQIAELALELPLP